MNRTVFTIVAWTAMALSASAQDEWKDRSVPAWGKEYPHADYMLFGSREKALQADYSGSEYYKCLNGEWNFSYAEDFRELPENFWATDYDDSAWGRIAVPSNWEFNGYGTPIYINSPFEMDPNTGAKKEPAFPDKIPGGAYRMWFSVPSDWDGREVFLQLGGVKSACWLYVNGQKAGYTEDSKVLREMRMGTRAYEKIARERYFMKADDEDIFVLSTDLPKNNDEEIENETVE